MHEFAIPPWNARGVLPPVHSVDPVSTLRSPYRVSLLDLVLRFGLSPRRRSILEGYLRFRAELFAIGITSGFQWLDGSFVDDVEGNEGREPGDVDVVTFYRLPSGSSQSALLENAPEMFDPAQSKAKYQVDGHFVNLEPANPARLVQESAYWYSVWSHRRDRLWRGFLEIELSPADDESAMNHLGLLAQEGTAP